MTGRTLRSAAAAHVRLTVLIARPQLITLLASFAVLGIVVGSGDLRPLTVLTEVAVVTAFVVSAVAINDLADIDVDRINLPHDARRPLMHQASARDLRAVAFAAAAASVIAGAAAAGAAGALVVTGGLALAVAYSARPMRLAARGSVAALVLPAGYVAVPYLTGVLAARGDVRAGDLPLLGAAYVGFIGRILLKDVRDVRGDALLGKRTFLVRHGQVVTCVASSACWLVGAVVTRAATHPNAAFDLAYAPRIAIALGLIAALARTSHPRVQTALISGSAVLGRGLVAALTLHLLALAGGVSSTSELRLQAVVLAAELAVVRRVMGPGIRATTSTGARTPARA